MKKCIRCNEEKNCEEFSIDRSRTDGLCCYCRACNSFLKKNVWVHTSSEKTREANRRYARSEKGKESARKASYKRHYGITIKDYDNLFAVQGGKCAVCHKPSEKILHVDHDHLTGEVRGLLCSRCNVFLGYIEADNTLYGKAKDYLEVRHEFNATIV